MKMKKWRIGESSVMKNDLLCIVSPLEQQKSVKCDDASKQKAKYIMILFYTFYDKNEKPSWIELNEDEYKTFIKVELKPIFPPDIYFMFCRVFENASENNKTVEELKL